MLFRSRFPAGLHARRALRVPAWREDVYYGLPRPGSRESSNSAGIIPERGRIPQGRRGFPSSRNRYRGGLAAPPCGGVSTTRLRQLNHSGIHEIRVSPFTALLSPHGQRRRPFPSIGPFRPSPRQSTKGGRQGDGRHADHFIDQAPPRRRRRRRRDRRGGGRVRAGGGSATASQAFFAGAIPRSRTPRGPCGQAPNASPPCRGSPRCARTGPARPPRARGGRARAPRPRDAHARRGRAFRPGA